MEPISAWAANAQSELKNLKPTAALSEEMDLSLYLTSDTLWLVKRWQDDSSIGFRTAFSPSGILTLENIDLKANKASVKLETDSLGYQVDISWNPENGQLRYSLNATPKIPLLIPYWPKDILSFDRKGKIKQKGTIHTQQRGTRSGIMYFNDGESGSVFYFQNLMALNDYCEGTQSSAGETVGGEWPEIGFSLPASNAGLEKNKSYILNDSFVVFSNEVPKTPADIAVQYLDKLADVYVQLPRPATTYYKWLDTAERGLQDLVYHKGCWTFAGGHSYLNAYVADYKSPPEVMVQLAVLVPMLEYLEWKGEADHKLVDELIAGLPAFYEPKMKTIVRWLPALESNLDHSEEQKKPRVMDSWYLHHPLMNLARLSDRNNETAKTLLMDSIDYAIKVAQHFKYEWPVFYQMDTLEVIKAETAEGEGGEKDVPGTYADLMLRLWKMTGDKKYFEEARQAAEKLKNLSFEVCYQANNTAFSAGALIRLYKETGDKTYLELSYVCIAALFDNMQLWECNYGHAKNFPTFFGIFPLKDAPYTAAYEEKEVYSALCDYLVQIQDLDVLPSIRLLIAEFVKHFIGRVLYYYPTMLKTDAIVEESKTGEIDPSLWIALEDLHDGWEQSGEVGQEVYGAGVAFGVIEKQYHKVKDESFMIFCDYPISSFRKRGKSVSFATQGDQRLSCRIVLLPQEPKDTYNFTVYIGNDSNKVEPMKVDKQAIEFSVSGNQKIKISW
jgi:hypothetical protein